jgi:hypothetical protein
VFSSLKGTSDPVATTTITRTTTTVTTSLRFAALGRPVTFTVRVSEVAPATGTPGGTVTIYDGGRALAVVPLVLGTATYRTTGLYFGKHVITAGYNGQGTVLMSESAPLNQYVGTGTQRFVAKAYKDLIGVNAPASFVNRWAKLLSQHLTTRTAVARMIIHIRGEVPYRTHLAEDSTLTGLLTDTTLTGRQMLVSFLYHKYVGLFPDDVTLSTYVNKLVRNQVTVEEVTARIIGSIAYVARV